jgi:hypothetical protein
MTLLFKKINWWHILQHLHFLFPQFLLFVFVNAFSIRNGPVIYLKAINCFFLLHFFIASGAAGGNIQTKFILRWWQSSGKCCIEPGPCWRNRIGCVHLPLLACGFENSKCYSMLNKIFLLDCCFIDTLLLNNSAVVADLFSVFLFCFCPF